MNELLTLDDLTAALDASGTAPIFLFKHSTRCPISSGAYQRVQRYLAEASPGTPVFYLIKVIESRPVSNEIASRLGVQHQSPQLILVRNHRAVWDTSHGGIDGPAIDRALAPSA